MVCQRKFFQNLIKLHRIPERVFDGIGHAVQPSFFHQPPIDRHLPMARDKGQHEQRFILHTCAKHLFVDAVGIRHLPVQYGKKSVAHP